MTSAAEETLQEVFENEKEIDINDALDSIVLTEEKEYEEGYKQGFEAGRLQGAAEGWNIGVSTGCQLGVELGYYQSYCQTIQEQQKHPTKITKLCEKIEEAVDNFPRSNVESEDILQIASRIRGQFKILQGFLGGKTGSLKKGVVVEKNDEMKQSFSF